jgi:hypothetical protein
LLEINNITTKFTDPGVASEEVVGVGFNGPCHPVLKTESKTCADDLGMSTVMLPTRLNG